MVDDFIKSRIPNAQQISDLLFTVVRYCFASICFHNTFLTNVLQPTSCMDTSAITMNIPEEIMSMAKVMNYQEASEGDSGLCVPRLTVIPPHVVLLSNLQAVNDHVSESCSHVVKELKQELEDCFVD